MAEEKKTAAVADTKADAFKAYLKQAGITGFYVREFDNPVHTRRFDSHLTVQGKSLPFMILLDDSVYTIIQVLVAEKAVTPEREKDDCLYLNKLNDQYRMLKYSADHEGNVLLTCTVPAGAAHFEPMLVLALAGQMETHLDDVYPGLMKALRK